MTVRSRGDHTAEGRPHADPHTSAIPLRLRRLLPGIVIGALAARAMAPVSDPDTFWHIAAGQHLLETGRFSGPDPFNTASTYPWVLHEWLPEVVLALAYQAGGLPGVAALRPLAVVGLVAALYLVARRRAPILVAILISSVAYLGMTASISLRPQLVTFALTAVATSAWLAAAEDGRPRWWLLPVTWVWACSHGMWFAGLAVGCAVILGMIADGTPRALVRRHGVVLLACVGAAALTPSGPKLLAAPLSVSNYTQFVTEWAPPSIFSVPVMAVGALVAVSGVALMRSGRPASWVHVLVLSAAVVAALAYTRTVGVGAAIAAPLAANILGPRAPLAVERIGRREVGGSVVLAISVAVLAVFSGMSAAERPGRVPDRVSASLADLPRDTVLCNDYMLGGWLLWQHPEVTTVVDGRTEVYTIAHMRQVVQWTNAAPGWQRINQALGCEAALVNEDSSISAALQDQLKWRAVDRDRGFVLLRP